MELKKSLQILYYISQKIGGAVDKITALKLLFFADRYHIRKYGRLVNNDVYFVMRHGPIASTTKNVVSFDSFIMKNESDFCEYIKKLNEHEYVYTEGEKELDHLSETDKEALDFSYDNFYKFAEKNSFNLANITHKYPEWQRFKDTIKNGELVEPVVMEDFFEKADIVNDPFNIIPEEVVQMSKEFYFGKYK